MKLSVGLRLVGSVLLVLLIALIVIISWSYVRSRDSLISTVQHDLLPARVEAESVILRRSMQDLQDASWRMGKELAAIEKRSGVEHSEQDHGEFEAFLQEFLENHRFAATLYFPAASKLFYYDAAPGWDDSDSAKMVAGMLSTWDGKSSQFRLLRNDRTGDMAVFLTFRILDGSRFLGGAGIGVSLENLRLSDSGVSGADASGTIHSPLTFVLDPRGLVLKGPGAAAGSPFTADQELLSVLLSRRDQNLSLELAEGNFIAAVKYLRETGCYIVEAVSVDQILGDLRESTRSMLLLSFLLFPLAFVLFSSMVDRVMGRQNASSGELSMRAGDLHRLLSGAGAENHQWGQGSGGSGARIEYVIKCPHETGSAVKTDGDELLADVLRDRAGTASGEMTALGGGDHSLPAAMVQIRGAAGELKRMSNEAELLLRDLRNPAGELSALLAKGQSDRQGGGARVGLRQEGVSQWSAGSRAADLMTEIRGGLAKTEGRIARIKAACSAAVDATSDLEGFIEAAVRDIGQICSLVDGETGAPGENRGRR